jgi:ribosomal protein L7/L12
MLTSAQKRELEDLLASGQKIVAVKRFREITGVGLQEALHAVEHLGRDAPSAASSNRPGPKAPDSGALRKAETAAMEALRSGNVVEAVKRYRGHTSLGLKESKEAVDALSLVHRTNGRIDAKLARRLIELVAAGQAQDAITQLIASKGYEEREASEIVGTLGALKMGGQAMGAGCLRMILGLFGLLAALVASAYLLGR